MRFGALPFWCRYGVHSWARDAWDKRGIVEFCWKCGKEREGQ